MVAMSHERGVGSDVSTNCEIIDTFTVRVDVVDSSRHLAPQALAWVLPYLTK
jgi:hypothetical protein